MVPVACRVCGTMGFISKLVFSMIKSPSTRIWGSTPSTSAMEMMVPRPRHSPMAEITGLVVMNEISSPALARMVPEVKMVGKEAFSASTMASWGFSSFFSSV